MGETKIEWCDFTHNEWLGCTKVSAACDSCYAEALAKRYGWVKWGAGEPRKRTSEVNRKKPFTWDRAARRDGVRRRVFCSSLADVFDTEVPNAWRLELMQTIHATPNLDWLLLTKRPQVAKKFFMSQAMPSNVWLGTTVEDQKMADLRVPVLLSIPASVHFLSCEPLLGPVDLRAYLNTMVDSPDFPGYPAWTRGLLPSVDWVITGGESGPKARPPMIGWLRSLRDQCRAARVAFHFKQWGEFAPDDPSAEHTAMRRVGKKAAGAKLDGVEHREFPR